MTAKELFDAGNLLAAIDQLTQDVRSNPRDLKSRIFLFELLCFSGEFQRAQRQLDAVAQTSGDVKVEMGVQAYRSVVQAEVARREFFTGSSRTPKFLCEPPKYTALHIEAVEKIRADAHEDLDHLLAESRTLRSPTAGTCNDQSFTEFRDGDDVLGPFLEVCFQGGYYWVPLEQMTRLEIQPPRTLRDLIWTPAAIGLRTSPRRDVLIPALYYPSHEHSDDLIKLGRITDWKPVGSETLVGLGQRTFFANDTEYPLLEVRTVEFTAN